MASSLCPHTFDPSRSGRCTRGYTAGIRVVCMELVAKRSLFICLNTRQAFKFVCILLAHTLHTLDRLLSTGDISAYNDDFDTLV